MLDTSQNSELPPPRNFINNNNNNSDILPPVSHNVNNNNNNDNNNFNTIISKERQNFIENMNILSDWINDITEKGFKRNKSLQEKKISKINNISNNISKMNININHLKSLKNKNFINLGLTNNKLDREIEKYYRALKDDGKYDKEIENVKNYFPGKIDKIKSLYNLKEDYVNETEQLKIECLEIEKKIKNVNFNISDLRKEIEKIGYNIKIYKKNIIALKGKIKDKEKSMLNFMINVNELVNKDELYNNI